MRKILFGILFCILSVMFIACDFGDVEVTSISLDTSDIEIDVSKTFDLATIYSITGEEGTATFEVADKTILSIECSVITALKEGTTTVNVKVVAGDTEQEGTINVKVVESRTVKVSFSSSNPAYKQDAETIKYGTTYSITSSPNLEGYRFLGYTLVDGSTDYILEVKEVKEDLTIYANFEKIKYTITYIINGETITEEYEYGTDVELTSRFVAGYDFLGWAKEENGTEYVSSLTIKDNVTLYACLKIKAAKLTYELNGGACDGLLNTIELGNDLDLTKYAPTKEGYTFLGWTDTADGTTYLTTKTINEDTKLYAQFQAIIYPVTYEMNGGAAYSTITGVEYGKTLVLPTPTKVGSKFLGWTLEENGTTYLTQIENVKGAVKVYAQWKEDAYTITYFLNDGVNYENAPTTIKPSDAITLGTPTKDGYTFLGWSTKEYANEFVTELKNISANVILYAKWIDGLVATPQTIEEIVAKLAGGEKITLLAGEYPGITITKPCTILGPNAYVDPNNDTRNAEATFNGVIAVKANEVTINGIRLTGNANVTATNCENCVVEYVLCQETLMGSGNNSAKAPVIAGNVKNLTINFCRWEKSTAGSANRNMILYGHTLENLTMKYNYFEGNTANYNDGIKIENSANGGNITDVTWKYGIKGNVEIAHNFFKGYQQYTIWFRHYQGTFSIVDNTFDSIGLSSSHAAANFITYAGAAGDNLKIDFSYNTVKNSQYLIRIDSSSVAPTCSITINHNKSINNSTNATIINNKGTTFTATGDGNYFDKEVTAVNCTLTNNVETEEAVKAWATDNSQEYSITYDLNGGSWAAKKMTMDEVIEDLLADLTVYYGKTATVSNVHEISEGASQTMYGFFDTNSEKWGWLKAYLIDCRGKDANRSSGKSYLESNNNAYWRYEVKGFVGKEAWATWPYSADYSSLTFRDAFDEVAPMGEAKAGADKYNSGVVTTLEAPVIDGKAFGGWLLPTGQIIESIPASMTGDLTLKATWEEIVYPNLVQLINFPQSGIKLYETLQLEWVVSPSNASNKEVTFASTDESIFTVDKYGTITAKALGSAKLRIKLEANADYELLVDVNVYKGDYFDASYETNSYVNIGEKINLKATYIDTLGQVQNVTWASLTPEIATVDNGCVTAIKEGLAQIRVTYNDKTFDFYVTVLPTDISDALKFIIENHRSNALTVYNLGIGAGTPEYYYDYVSSVNAYLFNNDLVIDRRYYDQLPEGTKNNGVMSSVEFITVHYTGNMNKGADADNNCDYFNNLDYKASIHYVTGRTNLTDLTGVASGYTQDAYLAFAGLSEKYAGWHASDTSLGETKWYATGIKVKEDDPEKPVISVQDGYYTFNGVKSTIAIPTRDDGIKVTGPTFVYNGITCNTINEMGLAWKIVDGEYYMGNTWWGTQAYGKALCSIGGNHNSIGIESCVDKGSDLEHTWHVTAQLVADIMVRYDLDITRVVGHHFFSGKDCPQPFLENDMQLWYVFIDMVEAEYAKLTTFKDVTFSAKAINSDGVLRDNGLLVQTDQAHCVTYEVTITIGGVEQKITLATCVESYYKCDCERTEDSLQIQGYEII